MELSLTDAAMQRLAVPEVVWVAITSGLTPHYHDRFSCGRGGKRAPRTVPTLRAAVIALGLTGCRHCTAEGRAQRVPRARGAA